MPTFRYTVSCPIDLNAFENVFQPFIVRESPSRIRLQLGDIQVAVDRNGFFSVRHARDAREASTTAKFVSELLLQHRIRSDDN